MKFDMWQPSGLVDVLISVAVDVIFREDGLLEYFSAKLYRSVHITAEKCLIILT